MVKTRFIVQTIVLLLIFGSIVHISAQTESVTGVSHAAIDQDDFVSVWTTDYTSSGSSASSQIRLPLVPSGSYNFHVDWGDNSTNLITSYNQAETTHTYATSGTYTVVINGTITGWQFNNGGDKLKIIEIKQWGSLGFGDVDSNFYGCANLVLTATDAPDLSQTTSLDNSFRNCAALGNSGDMSMWNTGTVTSMDHMFSGASNFNQPIGSWNVSSVTSIRYLFDGAFVFDQPLDSWDTGSVNDMSYTFYRAYAFNQSIESWDVSSVVTMQGTFASAFSFNQPLDSWDVSNVTSMSATFGNAYAFNQSLGSWNVSAVTSMYMMFYKAHSYNQDMSSWDVSNVVSMYAMFEDAYTFNQPLDSWSLKNLQDVSTMFAGAHSFNQPLGNWDVSRVKTMTYMFSQAYSFNGSIGAWNVSGVTDMASMFRDATSFNQDISDWNVSSVVNMMYMFYNASSFNRPLENWSVNHVENMMGMFSYASSFDQPLGAWNVSSVTSMASMFSFASDFNQTLSSWNVCQVSNMQSMFAFATGFDRPLGAWNVSKVRNMEYMFDGVELSVNNYDDLLIGWSNRTLQHNVVFNGGYSKYSAEALTARDVMINNYSWTITDRGLISTPGAPLFPDGIWNGEAVVLTWNPPSSDGNTEIKEYMIYRASGVDDSYVLLGSSVYLNYTDANVSLGSVYYYRISAVNAMGESALSEEVVVTVVALPGAPFDLQSQVDGEVVTLYWSPPESDGGSPISEYRVYRSDGNSDNFQLLSTTTSLNYTDSPVSPGTDYFYRVSAVNGLGEGRPSNEVHVHVAQVSSSTSTSKSSTTSTTGQDTVTTVTPSETSTPPTFEAVPAPAIFLLLPLLSLVRKKKRNIT